ncbi:hypothetical protein KY290_005296 [Solanum tuberosum]|uniref:Uncharacterized protein n=1 Tax=Solanum tuberosum TaxID=4113 RepID=A0ABQ7WDS8_SOLTU|nr:hypothetical protein KY290_005296 [Solanum tuberosum]
MMRSLPVSVMMLRSLPTNVVMPRLSFEEVRWEYKGLNKSPDGWCIFRISIISSTELDPSISFKACSSMTPVTDAIADSSSTVSATTHVVQFNRVAQLPLKLQAPSPTIIQNNLTVPNPNYQIWFSQDQLIQQAMMASVDPTIAPTIAASTSANKAWELHHTTYANKNYLQEVCSLSDALKVVGSPVNDDELIVKILSGLGPEYREISAAIRARDSSMSFEELFHKLTYHELSLKHQDLEKPSSMITVVVVQKSNTPPQFNRNNSHFNNQRQFKQSVKCQLCQKFGHTADVCRSKLHNHFEAKVNFASGLQSSGNSWVLDSGAIHHVTTEPHNLEEYIGTEEISMGDGLAYSEAVGTRPE